MFSVQLSINSGFTDQSLFVCVCLAVLVDAESVREGGAWDIFAPVIDMLKSPSSSECMAHISDISSVKYLIVECLVDSCVIFCVLSFISVCYPRGPAASSQPISFSSAREPPTIAEPIRYGYGTEPPTH